jgi:hypothetical protein
MITADIPVIMINEIITGLMPEKYLIKPGRIKKFNGIANRVIIHK